MIASCMSHRHSKGVQKIKVLVWWYLSNNITALSPEAESLLVKSFIMSTSIYCADAWTDIFCACPCSVLTSTVTK